MKAIRRKTPFDSPAAPAVSAATVAELATLRARLAEAETTLKAIRSGEVDVVVVNAKKGVRLFTLEGADQRYRVLIESMNEGALTLTADKTILYANQSFARMVKCPLEQVTGSSFRRFLSSADEAMLRSHMKQAVRGGSMIQVTLEAADGSFLPAQVSVREMTKDSSNCVTIGMVVTDMTEARRNEAVLRALTQRVVQVQEAERGRVARELHDNITQQLCAVLFCSQALADSLSDHEGPARVEALKLRNLLGVTAQEVERISHNLRSSVLEHLGLVAAFRDAIAEFSNRTGLSVKLQCAPLSTRPPADVELALYRIFEEALKNVERHARAKRLTVNLAREGEAVKLTIKDDGKGGNPEARSDHKSGQGGLDLLGMRERAGYLGGVLTVKSSRKAGTKIEVRIPVPPVAQQAA